MRDQRLAHVVLLDKGIGMTSRQCVNQLVRLLGCRRIGHAGTLDPDATGMLPVCVGEATKFVRFLVEQNKAYDVTLCLGVQTDTADAAGVVLSRQAVPTFNRTTLQAVLQLFEGEFEQMVPMVSAVRVAGKRLHEYARDGEVVARPVRRVFIKQIQLIEFDAQTIRIRVECGKGTYMRTLAEDIAAKLGTLAHVKILRRLWVAPFAPQQMVRFNDLSMQVEADEWPDCRGVLTLSEAFSWAVSVQLTTAQQLLLWQGQQVPWSQDLSRHPWLVLYDAAGHFFGVGQMVETGLKALRLLRQSS